MKRVIPLVLLILLTGCADSTKGYYRPVKGYETVVYQNLAIDIPASFKKAESIGTLTNDHEKDKRYKSDTDDHLLFTRMDSYYMIAFTCDLAEFKEAKLADLLEKRAGLRLGEKEEKSVFTSDAGVRKKTFKVSVQVLPARDLFADMTGFLTILSYRNDVWICACLSVEEMDETEEIIGSARVDNPGLIKKAYEAADLKEKDVKKEPQVSEWGRILVMNKRVCGERCEMFAKVDQIYDTSDSYSLFSEHQEELKVLGYVIPEDENYLAAKITCFYGSLKREAYDPYVDVQVVDEKGKKQARTYVFISEGDSFYVFYKEPKGVYGLKVGDSDSMIVWKE